MLAVLVLMLLVTLVPGAGRAQPPPIHSAPSDRYEVEATFDPMARTIAGRMRLTWINHTGQTQSSLPFRLYPNAPAYDGGRIVIDSATIDGQKATYGLDVDETVLRIDGAVPAQVGDQVEVILAFTTTIPIGTTMAVDVLHGSIDTGWWLADWLPILAGWEPDRGWFLEPPTTLGNPTFATSATWSLTLTVPSNLSVFGTGEITHRTPIGDALQLVTIETPLVRDLTLVLLPADSVDVSIRQIGDVWVRLVLPQEWAATDLSTGVLDTVATVLPVFTSWLGDLPGAELDLVPVSLNGFGGIAWSGSIWLDLERQATSDLSPSIQADLQFVLAHELAHQWVPLTIGSNNNRHNFLSESLASHLALLALVDSGAAGLEAYGLDDIAAPYRAMLERGEDGVVDDPVTSTVATADRAALVYGKGVIGFEAIRQAIGTEAYLAGLTIYAESFRFAESTPTDLRRAFETASGQDLEPLWTLWFTTATSDLNDLDAILAGFSRP